MAKLVEGDRRITDSVAATIGMFDGVHRGHRYVIECLHKEAEKRGMKSAVITFRQHPRNVLDPGGSLRMLLSYAERIADLQATAADYVIPIDFTSSLARLSAKEFIEHIRNRYGVRFLLVGYDHRFGHNREESFCDYVRHGETLGVEVAQIPEFFLEEKHISSSVVRKLISEGSVKEAGRILCSPFCMEGTVVEGFRNGHKLGFPTANICLSDPLQIVPENGVYAVWVDYGGCRYGGMMNIGVRPTFGGSKAVSLEVHIFDFSEDIYGKKLRVVFVDRLRDERKMDSLEELRLQLAADREKAKSILGIDSKK